MTMLVIDRRSCSPLQKDFFFLLFLSEDSCGCMGGDTKAELFKYAVLCNSPVEV